MQNTNVLYLLSQFDNTKLSFGNANDFKGSVYEYIAFVSNRLGQTISYEKSRYDSAVVTVNTLLDARDDVSGVVVGSAIQASETWIFPAVMTTESFSIPSS